MTILDRLQESTSGMRRNVTRPIRLDVVARETGNDRPGLASGYAPQQEHELRATVAVTFWANSAQYRDARRIAEQALASAMYGDVIAALHKIAHAVSDGDDTDALTMIADLRKQLTAD